MESEGFLVDADVLRDLGQTFRARIAELVEEIAATAGRMEAARSFGQQTLVVALAIAAGISFVVALRELQARKQ